MRDKHKINGKPFTGGCKRNRICDLRERAAGLVSSSFHKLMDWNDCSTCVLFGDGAVAAVVCPDEEYCILSSIQGSDGARGGVLSCGGRRNSNPYVTNGMDPSFVSMDGQEVYKFAVRTVPKAITEAVEQVGLTVEDIDLFVLHQANIHILEYVSKPLKVLMEK